MIQRHKKDDQQHDTYDDGHGDLYCAVRAFADDFPGAGVDGEMVQFVVVSISADPGGEEDIF